MSFEAVEAVLEQSESREAARLVMICIAERADENRQAYPSHADIAHRARLNPQVVGRILDRLVESGELMRMYRVGTSAAYIVTIGLTQAQIEKCCKKSWGKSLRQVVAVNQYLGEQMRRSKGNSSTLLPNVEGSSNANQEQLPFYPESTPPSSESISPPSSERRSEPSVNHQEPSFPETPQNHELFVFPSPNRQQRKINNCKADELTKTTLHKFYMLYPELVFDARRDLAGGRALAEVVSGNWVLMDEAAKRLIGEYTPSGPYGMVKTCNKLRQQHAPQAAALPTQMVSMSDGTLATPYRPY